MQKYPQMQYLMTVHLKTVDQKQTKADWQTEVDLPFDVKAPKDGASENYWTVKWDSTNNKVIAE